MSTARTRWIVAAFVAVNAATVAIAQDYPIRPIKIIQGFAAGGNADAVARILGGEMSKGLGQPMIVEAKPGAGGNLGADAVAKAAPDGYTLLLATGGHAVSGALYKSLPYNSVDGFEWISTSSVISFMLVGRGDAKARSLRELLQAARSSPGSVTFGTAGIGATQHLTGELLASMAGVKLTHVPYKGDAAAVTGLLGGEVNFVIAPATTVLSHIKAGRFIALGVSGNTRWAGLPEVPTVVEGGVAGFDVRSWTGMAAPAGTPRALVNRLHAELLRALQVPDVRGKLEAIGGEVRGATPEEMRNHVASEVARWSRVIREANIQRN